jgi:hypothetical protein
MAVIEEVSQHLLPFLYTLDPDLNLDQLRFGPWGAIVSLPVGFRSFAEIVMAGINARRLKFVRDAKSPTPQRFPVSPYDLGGGPAAGPYDMTQANLMTETNLRALLCNRLGLEVIYKNRPDSEKDAGIRVTLTTKQKNEGITLYYILEMPEVEAEVPAFRAKYQRAAELYPELAVLELDPRVVSRDHPIFEDLRRLFRLLDEE